MGVNDTDVSTRVAILEEKLRGYIDARDIQAAEYARRLEELNHVMTREAQRDGLYLLREVHDNFYLEYQTWRHTVDEQLAIARGSKAAYYAVLSVVLSAGAVAIAALKHFAI